MSEAETPLPPQSSQLESPEKNSSLTTALWVYNHHASTVISAANGGDAQDQVVDKMESSHGRVGESKDLYWCLGLWVNCSGVQSYTR